MIWSLFMILAVITPVRPLIVFASIILMVRLLFIVNLLFPLNLYLFLTIWFLIIVFCSFRAVLQPFDTVRRTPLTQWERRTKSVSRNRVNILTPLIRSVYLCGAPPLFCANYVPRRQRSWPVNILYVMFSQFMKSTLLPEWESGFSIPWFNPFILDMQKWHRWSPDFNGFEESNARWSARARRANKTKVFPGGRAASDSRAGIARAQRRKKKLWRKIWKDFDVSEKFLNIYISQF